MLHTAPPVVYSRPPLEGETARAGGLLELGLRLARRSRGGLEVVRVRDDGADAGVADEGEFLAGELVVPRP